MWNRTNAEKKANPLWFDPQATQIPAKHHTWNHLGKPIKSGKVICFIYVYQSFSNAVIKVL